MKLNTLQRIGRMHWLRGRDRILRAFSNPDRQQPVLFETDFFGLPYSGYMDNFIDWTVFYYGAFSVNELQLLAALAAGLRARGKPVNFYDVGANVGHHSLFMSRHAEHIFAFEPFAKVRSEMERKFNHAGVHNATVFPVALGSHGGVAAFHPPTGSETKALEPLARYCRITPRRIPFRSRWSVATISSQPIGCPPSRCSR